MIKKTCLLAVMLLFCGFIKDGSAVLPPPEPEPDITVTDALAPFDDLRMPYGSETESTSTDYGVLIINDGTSPLTLGAITDLSAPFELLAHSCSGAILNPGDSCSLTVRFSPVSTGDFFGSFNIGSDDPDEATVSVYISGRGVTDPVVNEAPSEAGLVSPPNNSLGVATPVTFKWNKSTDPEGGLLTYDLYVCEDSTFATCESPVNPTAITASFVRKGFLYAGGGLGLGFVVFGLIVASDGSLRRRTALLCGAILISAVMLLVACGGGGGGGGGGDSSEPPITYEVTGELLGSTVYYWKVVTEDDAGNRTDSAVWSFTTG